MPVLGFTISATTRPPRPEEENGKDYYFLKIKEFEKKIEEKAFIEYEMVYKGKYYGTLKSELERIWEKDKIPLRVVDVVGASELKRKFSTKALSLFIQPPSMDALYNRLKGRATENTEALEERMKRANMEMELATQFDHIIINDLLTEAVEQAKGVITSFINSLRQTSSPSGN